MVFVVGDGVGHYGRGRLLQLRLDPTCSKDPNLKTRGHQRFDVFNAPGVIPLPIGPSDEQGRGERERRDAESARKCIKK